MFNKKTYDVVMKIMVCLHFVNVLICSKNVFDLISGAILSVLILKIVIVSLKFILSVPYVTDDQKSRLEKNRKSVILMMFDKIKKANYMGAIVFSAIFLGALLYVYINNLYMFFIHNQTYGFVYFIGISFFLGTGLGLLKSICLKTIE